jgi:hypothetical protein
VLSGPWPSMRRRRCRSGICRVSLVGRLVLQLVIECTHGFPSGPKTTPLGSVFFSFSCCSTRWSCSGEASKGWGGNPVVISTAQRKRDKTGRYSSVMGISPSPQVSLTRRRRAVCSDLLLSLSEMQSVLIVNEVKRHRLARGSADLTGHGISGFGGDAGHV